MTHTSFEYLPQEIIQYIHLLALNSNLPLVSKQVHHSLSSLPAAYAARYLLALHKPSGPHEILNRSVRYPICSVGVAKEIKRIWDKRRGYVPPVIRTRSATADLKDGGGNGTVPDEVDDDDNDNPDDNDNDDRSGLSTPSTTAPALTCSELPRRLFRPPKNELEPIHPLIQYLFQTYSPSANSHKGYPLCRAVLTANYDLISFLLAHRADPGIKDHLPVQVAISVKDVRAVRMLVERTDEERKETVDDEAGRKQGRERRRVKRRRLSDRVSITPALVECALKKGSKDIVEYFVQEKDSDIKNMSPGHSKYNYHNRMTLHGNDIAREWVKSACCGQLKVELHMLYRDVPMDGKGLLDNSGPVGVGTSAQGGPHGGAKSVYFLHQGDRASARLRLFPVAFREEVKREKARAEAESEKETAEPKGEEVSVAAKSEQPNMGTVQSSEVQMGALEGEHSV